MIKDELEKINCKILISGDRYLYDGESVPRVTEILSSMLHEEYIVQWANNLGFKHKGYRATLNEAANKGTYTHLSIEKYLQSGIEPDYDSLPNLCQETVKNTFASFLSWWKAISSKNDIEIVYQEKKLVCKWFGGTLDLLIKINDKYWLLDFKTSNYLSYKYTLQLAAYRYMLKEICGIDTDGCIVLQLSKVENRFMEQVLDFNEDDMISYMNDCEETFLSLVYAYYRRKDIEQQYSERWSKNGARKFV